MKRKYYATGNGGGGTVVYFFDSEKERDDFVAWNDSFDQRSKISHSDAIRWGEATEFGWVENKIKL